MAYLDNTGLAQVWFKVCARIDSKVEGAKGKSLYQSWLDTGHTGTEADFVKDMKGKPGDPGEPGDPGKSAYDLWKEQGNEGSVQDFLDSVKGKDGKSGKSAYELWKEQGNDGSMQDFLDSVKGKDGKSAYQLWLEKNPMGGSEDDFLTSLKGKDGAAGKSVYQSWLDSGQTGSEADFVEDMKGEPGKQGDTGKSAYDLWKEQGNEGTVTDFFESIRGPKGDPLKASTRTVTLDVAGWPSDRHRIAAVEGVTATNTVIVTPAPESIGTYGKCGVYAAAQGEGSLTFVCAKQPEESLTVNMLII